MPLYVVFFDNSQAEQVAQIIDFSDLFSEEDDEECDGDCGSCDAKESCGEYDEEDSEEEK